jgi:hypothetical protein
MSVRMRRRDEARRATLSRGTPTTTQPCTSATSLHRRSSGGDPRSGWRGTRDARRERTVCQALVIARSRASTRPGHRPGAPPAQAALKRCATGATRKWQPAFIGAPAATRAAGGGAPERAARAHRVPSARDRALSGVHPPGPQARRAAGLGSAKALRYRCHAEMAASLYRGTGGDPRSGWRSARAPGACAPCSKR